MPDFHTLELPAYKIADVLNEKLRTNDAVVVTAPPGAGKSTLLPLTMLNAVDSGKIVMLEPRRIAARQVAERMASLLGESVGKTVGYSMRFESKLSPKARIEVVTEGVLTRKLVQDMALEDTAVVVFDEFHERSLTSDVALALTREVQHLLRPDLKIVIMSATIDTAMLCQQLNAPLIECEGRMFDVDTIMKPRERDTTDTESIARDVCHTIREAHAENEGDILAFLPGQGEIMRCVEMLGNSLGDTHICPLYGLLSSEEQRMAIAPSRKGERKVVLATSIVETSITIEGVRIVVDSGFCRRMVHDHRTGLSHLDTVRISHDMATQRRGRAGRVAEGTCYQLWNKALDFLMQDNRTPEIADADLSSTILDVMSWGADNVEELPWITPPPHANVIKALQLLEMLGAVERLESKDDGWKLTDKGKQMSKLPCHPRIAKMMIEARGDELKALAADIAAVLDERDPLASAENDTDINTRIILLREARRKHNIGRFGRIAKIAEQYRRMVHCREDNNVPDRMDTGRLLANAYPERVGRQQGNGHYRMSGGENAVIDTADMMSAYDWIVVASMNAANGKVFLSSPVNPQQLELKQFDNVMWNSKLGCLVAQHEYRIGKLVVESKPIHNIQQEDKARIIAKAALKDGLSMFNFDDDVQRLQRRIATVSSWHGELMLPDITTDAVLAKAEEWLPLYIGKATTSAELKKIDMKAVIWGLLEYEQQQNVERLAPTHVQMPNGHRIRVDYRQGAEAPVVSVRLQECFGMTETPRVNDGNQPLLMELLSPGFKPVQLTQDLHSFWETTYFDVRKELRRRYPKHAWPEDPQK